MGKSLRPRRHHCALRATVKLVAASTRLTGVPICPMMEAWATVCVSPSAKIANIRDARRK
jgi:hypothetical protein